ncbi:MAG: ribbon-helix-helix protein, CopG family [Pyrinomonadaceae bacterium]
MQNISLKLPRTLDAKLTAAAKQRGASKSAVVREALHDYLDRDGEPDANSFAEMAREFIGCVDGGPVDLSFNKRRMKGFGA